MIVRWCSPIAVSDVVRDIIITAIVIRNVVRRDVYNNNIIAAVHRDTTRSSNVVPSARREKLFLDRKRSEFVAADGGDCFMVERAPTTVSSTASSAWAPGHAWSQYCSPSPGSTLATLMPSALHRGPLRISPVKSEPYDMAADIPPSISKSNFYVQYLLYITISLSTSIYIWVLDYNPYLAYNNHIYNFFYLNTMVCFN